MAISKSFDDITLFSRFDYNFLRGERVGIIGKNGTGKSTFLNIITGSVKPDTGKVVIGDTVKFGYYTQKGDSHQGGSESDRCSTRVWRLYTLEKKAGKSRPNNFWNASCLTVKNNTTS